ncbi:MAG: peptidoglycan-binding domain-containing protein [Clostridiales bacterium]|nr:peptidoglycan-binding domain-containing protein [Clostridiales bacterium]
MILTEMLMNAASAPMPDALLRPGDRDGDVRNLQRMLRAVGYEMEIDGLFGRITLECVRSFQASHGLPRDGVVGPVTWHALQAACGEVISDE